MVYLFGLFDDFFVQTFWKLKQFELVLVPKSVYSTRSLLPLLQTSHILFDLAYVFAVPHSLQLIQVKRGVLLSQHCLLFDLEVAELWSELWQFKGKGSLQEGEFEMIVGVYIYAHLFV